MGCRSAAFSVARSVARQSFPAMAACYRAAGGRCPPLMLKAMNIAEYHPDSNFYTLGRALSLTERFDGPVVECGVYKGRTLLGMAHLLRQRGLREVPIVGCDSFEGFPDPDAQDALPDGTIHERAQRGVFADTSIEALSAKLRALEYDRQVTLVKGFFENTLHTLPHERYSLVHVDVDLYGSYKTCLEYFYPKLSPGAFMVFDEYDYDAHKYPGAQRAIDEFLEDKPEKIDRFPETRHARYFIRKI
jgi:O-methyltransferase